MMPGNEKRKNVISLRREQGARPFMVGSATMAIGIGLAIVEVLLEVRMNFTYVVPHPTPITEILGSKLGSERCR
jgi:hypothetical protein